ncbi:MAG: GNAT family N-acetyltransferase [Gammaproteobacteria bacterium]|nr:MAG: GNAT family N-acetyltransferase [Gammaproteobacteria bacterium]
MVNINVYEDIRSIPDKLQALWQHGNHGQHVEQNKNKLEFDSSYEWYKELLNYALKPGASPIIICAEENNSTVILPLQIYYKNEKKHLGALTTIYSHNFSPIIISNNSSNSELISHCIGYAIKNYLPEIIDIEPINPKGVLITPLIKGIKHHMVTDTYFRFGNWLHTDISSFDEYKNNLQTQLKNTINRRQKKLDKSHVWELKVYTKIEEIAPAYQEFKYLYQLRWKKEEGNREFFDAIIMDLAEKGQLRLGILYIDNRPAAAQIWFNIGQRSSIFKLAFDESYKEFSPGTLLTYKMADYSINQDQATILDFLSGDDYYKKQWMSQRDEKWGIIAFNHRTAYGIFAATRHFGGKLVKRLNFFPSKKAG